jgi:hypothetical protein
VCKKGSPRNQTRQALDRAIGGLAGRQYGNVTRQQLLSLGMGVEAIKSQQRAGRLYRVHSGVYAVGHPPVTPLERAAAAVLACGPHAVLSHYSALALWQLDKRWRWPADVTVTRGHPRSNGITVHRSPIDRRDVTVQHGIRVTAPARTLLDCALTLTQRALRRAVNDARHGRILLDDTLAHTLKRYPHHPGVKRLREATDGPRTRSGWEDDFLKFCARYDLPTPKVNTMVCGFEVDALFEDAKLIVELDSWEFHNDRGAFETDRERDAVTTAAGYTTVRITWRRLKTKPELEARRLLHIVAQRQFAHGD